MKLTENQIKAIFEIATDINSQHCGAKPIERSAENFRIIYPASASLTDEEYMKFFNETSVRTEDFRNKMVCFLSYMHVAGDICYGKISN